MTLDMWVSGPMFMTHWDPPDHAISNFQVQSKQGCLFHTPSCNARIVWGFCFFFNVQLKSFLKQWKARNCNLGQNLSIFMPSKQVDGAARERSLTGAGGSAWCLTTDISLEGSRMGARLSTGKPTLEEGHFPSLLPRSNSVFFRLWKFREQIYHGGKLNWRGFPAERPPRTPHQRPPVSGKD